MLPRHCVQSRLQLAHVAPHALLHRGDLYHELTVLKRSTTTSSASTADLTPVAAVSKAGHSHLGCNNDDITGVVIIDVGIDVGIFEEDSCEHTLCILLDSVLHVLHHSWSIIRIQPPPKPRCEHATIPCPSGLKYSAPVRCFPQTVLPRGEIVLRSHPIITLSCSCWLAGPRANTQDKPETRTKTPRLLIELDFTCTSSVASVRRY